MSTTPVWDAAALLSTQLGATQPEPISYGWPDTAITGGATPQDGLTPTIENGDTTITGAIAGAKRWRSELVACIGTSSPHAPLTATRGMRITVEFDLRLSAGFATEPADNHHVLAQLHGPQLSGGWPPPPVTLVWQNGSYRVSSSNGSPRDDGTIIPTFDEAMPRIWLPRAARVETWHRWRITALLAGPGCGRVDVWLDDNRVVHDWRPRAGTFYTPAPTPAGENPASHAWLYCKYGSYGGGSPHNVERVARHRGMRLTIHDVNNIRTWRAPASTARTGT